MAGRLICIVGPSGAGKDSLIDYCRTRLSGDGSFVFARRVVTRETSAHESHDTLSQEAFARAERNGEFFLSWRAHGLAYALPSGIATDLEVGKTVIANISRTVLDELARMEVSTHVVNVSAHPDILAQRLLNRGRENADMSRQRLGRDVAAIPQGLGLTDIDNSGELPLAGEKLLAVLRSADH